MIRTIDGSALCVAFVIERVSREVDGKILPIKL
jgi:hypothetical protein